LLALADILPGRLADRRLTQAPYNRRS